MNAITQDLATTISLIVKADVDSRDYVMDTFRRPFESKRHLIDAVIKYHHAINRVFTVQRSSKSRYTVVCNRKHDPQCPFVLRFLFKSDTNTTSFTSFECHTCLEVDLSDNEMRTIHLSRLPSINKIFNALYPTSTPHELRKMLKMVGISVTTNTSFHLNNELFKQALRGALTQYSLLPPYVDILNNKKHKANLELTTDGIFKRVVVLYSEGMRAFEFFNCFGLQLDGAFIKSKASGTVLTACFKQPNNHIQVLGVAVVSTESEDNWSWFLLFIKKHLPTLPSFIISDRGPGLLAAIRSVYPEVNQFYCLRHLISNLRLNSNSKQITTSIWSAARSLSGAHFRTSIQKVKQLNPTDSVWKFLTDAGIEKCSTLYATMPRFSILTTNNVEAWNSRIRDIRKLRIVDILLSIEEIIWKKRKEMLSKSEQWRSMTLYASNHLKNISPTADGMNVTLIQPEQIILTLPLTKDQANPSIVLHSSSSMAYVSSSKHLCPTIYFVDLDAPKQKCSCGYYAQHLLPCSHMLAIIKTLDFPVEDYVGSCFLASKYREAYRSDDNFDHTKLEDLNLRPNDNVNPPGKVKKRGRAKIARYKSPAESKQSKKKLKNQPDNDNNNI